MNKIKIMDSNINNRKFKSVQYVEISEYEHKLPELKVIYRFERPQNLLTLIVNDVVLSTFNGEKGKYIWEKINNENVNCDLSDTEIIHCACETTGIDYEDIFANSRKKEIVWARQMAMVEIYNNRRTTLDVVGSIFKKDHTTVIHAQKLMQLNNGELGIERSNWLKKFKFKIEETKKSKYNESQNIFQTKE